MDEHSSISSSVALQNYHKLIEFKVSIAIDVVSSADALDLLRTEEPVIADKSAEGLIFGIVNCDDLSGEKVAYIINCA